MDYSCACVEVMSYHYVFTDRADQAAVPWLKGQCKTVIVDCVRSMHAAKVVHDFGRAEGVVSQAWLCHAMQRIHKLSQHFFTSSQMWNKIQRITAKSLIFASDR